MSSLSEQLQNLGFRANETTAETASETVQIDKSQVVRIQRQTKGRKGKGVTVIFDLPQQEDLLRDYAQQLRKSCGVGGSIKNGTIELQGDQRNAAQQFLEQQGFKVKLAGG